MKFYHSIFLASQIILAPLASAGWHAGGGLLPTDDTNPWFIDNVKEVKYCIKIDEANFGTTIDAAREKIAAAFDYWKNDFKTVNPIKFTDTDQKTEYQFSIATQSFIEESCNEKTDIVFALGVLTNEQIARDIPAPNLTVGLAVRTEYDRETLRGKGFVYISPEMGPLALNGQTNWGPVLPKRWTYASGKLLEIVLTHEVGHVFGMTHEYENTVMEEYVPQLVISEFMSQFVDWEHFIIPATQRLTNLTNNAFSSDGIGHAKKDLGLSPEVEKLTISRDKSASRALIYATKKGQQERTLVASLRPTGLTQVNSNEYLKLFLTKSQKVFALSVADSGLPISAFIDYIGRESFEIEPVTNDIKKLQITASFDSMSMRLSYADEQGKIIIDRVKLDKDDYLNFGTLRSRLRK